MGETTIRMAFAGGGTAGHVNPIVAMVEWMRPRCEMEAVYFVNRGKIEERLIPSRFPWMRTVPLKVRGFRRPLHHPDNLLVLFSLVPAIVKALLTMANFKPDCVICTGGYITGPVAIAAWLLGIPVYLHEQNSVVGVANRIALRFAKKLFISFPDALETIPKKFRGKVVVTGNPVRKPRMSEEKLDEFVKSLGLDGRSRKVLVMGGSRGSDFLNYLVEKVHDRIDAQFIVLTGSSRWTQRLNRFPNVVAFDYLDEVPDLLRIIDVAVTRGGATTIWELYISGVPALVIPWEGATEGHQLRNAEFLQRLGRAFVIREEAASEERAVEMLGELLERGRGTTLDPDEVVRKILSEIPEVRSKCSITWLE